MIVLQKSLNPLDRIFTARILHFSLKNKQSFSIKELATNITRKKQFQICIPMNKDCSRVFSISI